MPTVGEPIFFRNKFPVTLHNPQMVSLKHTGVKLNRLGRLYIVLRVTSCSCQSYRTAIAVLQPLLPELPL